MDRAEELAYGLSAVQQATSHEDLSRVLHELRDRFGVTHMAYYAPRAVTKAETSDIFLAAGHPEWCSHYIERGYADIDPVMREVRRSSLPVDWDTVEHSSAAARRYFNELSKFEIGRRGMTIPSFAPDGELGFLSFSSNHVRDSDWLAFRNERTPDLAYIGLHLHVVAMRIANGFPNSAAVKLTPQGKRLLSLFAQGHKPAAIAHLTDLSIHTVRMHLDKAQERLGGKTKAEAVKKAVDLGLISRKARMLGVVFAVEFSTNADFLSLVANSIS